MLGTARQRLDPHRTGPGKQVEHTRAVDQVETAESVEHRLAHLVGGGPCGISRGRFDPPAPQVTRNHSHRGQTTEVITPSESIVCVDCGGPCHLITMPREDNSWEVGDVVTYRCRDCRDRWDLILTEDDSDD